MLERILSENADKGFINTVWPDYLREKSFEWWMDVTGIGTSFTGGLMGNITVGVTGTSMAIIPELFDFASRMQPENPESIPFKENMSLLFYDTWPNLVITGGAYACGLLIRQYFKYKRNQGYVNHNGDHIDD